MISLLFILGPVTKMLNPPLYLVGHTAITAAIAGAF